VRRVTSGSFQFVDTGANSKDCVVTADALNGIYGDFTRRLAFPDRSDATLWRRWRARLKRELTETLRLKDLGKVPTPSVEMDSQVDCGEYVRHKIVYETVPGIRVSAYLLIPHSQHPRKVAVICPHGHVPGAKDNVVGLTDPLGVAYGHELAMGGVVVLAPDNAGMGERDVPTRQDGSTGCFLLWSRLNQMGLDLTGLRIFDLMAGVNLLSSLDEVDADRIGCAGLSGGCWLSQVLAALDSRIKAVVLSGFFTSFVQTTWHGHCVCHHPFGIGKFCDMPDISALIAPRPQFVESGISDSRYPHEPAFTLVQQAYALNGAEDALGLHRYRGGHKFCGKKSIPWLIDRLSEEK
jgi:hypothetical protein